MNLTTKTLIAGAALATMMTGALALSESEAVTPPELIGAELGTTADQITASLIALGYTVDEIEREDGAWEAEITKDGAEFELHVDAATGEAVSDD